MIKEIIRKIINDTFLEKIADKLYKIYSKKTLSEEYNIQTIKIMKTILRKDSCCVDIGCHEGLFLKEFIRLSPKGTHYAIEPIPHLYTELTNTYAKNKNLKLFQLALSEKKGESSFQYVVSNPGYSGLRQRRYDRPNEQIQEIKVRTDLLDNIIHEEVQINFIKIDVEGAELQVLKGAVKTIKRCLPTIVFEHGLGGSDHYGTKPEDIHELLVQTCGLRLFVMSDWLKSKGKNSLTLDEFKNQYYNGKNFYFMASF